MNTQFLWALPELAFARAIIELPRMASSRGGVIGGGSVIPGTSLCALCVFQVRCQPPCSGHFPVASRLAGFLGHAACQGQVASGAPIMYSKPLDDDGFSSGVVLSRQHTMCSYEISGSNLLINPGQTNDVKLLRRLARQYAPDGQSSIATPFWPSAYSLLERKSPMWEIYALWP